MHQSISLCLLCLLCVALRVEPADGQAPVGSSHFVVTGVGLSSTELESTLRQCEDARRELTKTWNVVESEREWSPKCAICIHRDRMSYTKAIGMEGAQTEGSSSIQVDKGQVVGRRIDLFSASKGFLPALKHELTHVVIADRFKGQVPPHWFDEGIAMLADQREKQLLHLRDCFESVGTRRSLPLEKLLSLEQFQSAEQMAPFYGQSLTLVSMLAEKQPASVLVDFAIDAKSLGYAAALKKHYDIGSVKSLEKEWLAYVQRRRAAGQPLDVLIRG